MTWTTHKIKFVTGSSTQSKIENIRRERVDLLVGSTGGLSKMFGGNLFFSDFIDTIVLDEVDTLVDDSFKGTFYSETAGEMWNRRTKVPKIAPELLFPINGITDYGHPDRKLPSLNGQKSTPNPKFLGTAKAYFVCHIGPIFQISLIYAFIGCP